MTLYTKALLVLLILSIPIAFDVHLVHRGINLSGPGGISISVTFVIAVAIMLLWAGGLGFEERGRLNYFSSTTIPLLLMMFAGMVSMLNTCDKLLSVSGIFLYAKVFLVYFISANAVRSENDVLLIMKTLLIACILGSVIYVPQNIVRMGVGRGDEVIFRAKGIIGSPSVMATFVSSVLLMALGIMFMKKRSSLKTLVLVAFFAGIPALILTFCRAPWMNFSTCVLLGVLYGLKRGWLKGGTLVGFMGAGAIAVALLWPMISWRLSADHSAGLDERMNLMKIAWNMIKDNPIIGIGINTYGDRFKAFIPDELGHMWVYAVHNQYLLVWAETGTLGFGILVFFLLGVVKKGIRCARSKNDLLAPLSLGLLLGFVTILLDMFWGIYASEQAVSHIWLFAGTIVGMNGLVYSQPRRIAA